MIKTVRFSVISACTLILVACGFAPSPSVQPIVNPEAVPALSLTLQAQNGADTFNTVGQVIQYVYIVGNTGQDILAGPVTVVDDKTTVGCPEVNTVGNLDGNLDPNEAVTCSATYSVTQGDLDAGNVTNNATATVGGTNSNLATVTVPMAQNRLLTLSKAANPTTFNQAGQTITYTYIILNTGNVTLQGPFTITDDKTTVACTEPADGLLSPNEEMSCNSTYGTVQADLDLGSVVNSATATGGGATSNTATTTVTAGSVTQAPPSPSPTPSNLTTGTTIQHQVASGEWMYQIARCYGANIKNTIKANTQLTNPNEISAGMLITVPSIGSDGTVYGPPCVVLHTVQSGDTWDSIAQRYNADLLVLQRANPGALSAGRVLKVPINSAGGTAIYK